MKVVRRIARDGGSGSLARAVSRAARLALASDGASGIRGYIQPVRLRRWVIEYGDYLLAGLIGAVYVGEETLSQEITEHRPWAVLVALVFAAALAARRRLPLVLLLVGAVVIVLNHTVLDGVAEGGAFLFGFIIGIYSAGRYARGSTFWLCGAMVLGAIPLAAFDPHQSPGFGDFAFFTMYLTGPFVTGRLVRYRTERERHWESQAAAARADREEKARQAVVAERARIARELHDVVSHAISVIVLQARGGRRVLDAAPADAREAFDVIEHAGEQALVEMRRLLTMLRQTEEDLVLAPQPSLKRIGELAAQLTSTGLPVDVSIEGEPVEVPPGIDVSAYRIVQEALTNTLKHAGPAHARVVVRYRADELELEVADDGPGTGTAGGSGQGLAGIRERVGIYGGELHAGRRPEGGYLVRARLPLTAAP